MQGTLRTADASFRSTSKPATRTEATRAPLFSVHWRNRDQPHSSTGYLPRSRGKAGTSVTPEPGSSHFWENPPATQRRAAHIRLTAWMRKSQRSKPCEVSRKTSVPTRAEPGRQTVLRRSSNSCVLPIEQATLSTRSPSRRDSHSRTSARSSVSIQFRRNALAMAKSCGVSPRRPSRAKTAPTAADRCVHRRAAGRGSCGRVAPHCPAQAGWQVANHEATELPCARGRSLATAMTQ